MQMTENIKKWWNKYLLTEDDINQIIKKVISTKYEDDEELLTRINTELEVMNEKKDDDIFLKDSWEVYRDD